MKKNVAIVLAAGQGKRMGGSTQKQYMELDGFPILYYSLRAFQESQCIEEIVLVTQESEVERCHKQFVKEYRLSKVKKIVSGGAERYESVWKGLQTLKDDVRYVFIHDGARPFISQEIIERGLQCVEKHHACVAGVKAKDTVKLADGLDFAEQTPPREHVWLIQTPQIFEVGLIKQAYSILEKKQYKHATDDAMVVEYFLDQKVKLFEGDYTNIKITTPEDMDVAEVFLKRNKKNQRQY